MKIAFATQDLKRVDAHFGWAKNIAIYEIGRKDINSLRPFNLMATSRRTATRTNLHRRSRRSRIGAILYVAAIGGSGAARVVANNIIR